MKTAFAAFVLLTCPMASIAGPCTAEVIKSIRAAGKSDAEIEAACGHAPADLRALSGEWRVLLISSNFTGFERLGVSSIPTLSYWDIEAAGGNLDIIVTNPQNVEITRETVAPHQVGKRMEFELLDRLYVLNLVEGERILGDVFDGDPGAANALGSIEMRRDAR